MADCLSPEQLAAFIAQKNAEAAAAQQAIIDAKNAADAAKRAEDDKTNIRVVPIEVTNDQSEIQLIGLFFNMPSIREEDEPESGLVIEKDVLDRSTGVIFGRYRYKADARGKIVYRAYLDGKDIAEGGFNLPYGKFEGYIDVPLFRYPNVAKQNKDGVHWLKVQSGIITGITEGALGLTEWGKVRSITVADFTIKLLPHKTE